MHLKIYVTENIFLCTLFHQSLCISFNRLELTQEITFPINVDCITKIVFYTDGFKSNVVLWYFLASDMRSKKNLQFNFPHQNLNVEHKNLV